jgi:hypothetical protein
MVIIIAILIIAVILGYNLTILAYLGIILFSWGIGFFILILLIAIWNRLKKEK